MVGGDLADNDPASGTTAPPGSQLPSEPAATGTVPPIPQATLSPPRPIGLRDLPGAAFIHWQEGDPRTKRLVVRDRDGAALATWLAPDGLVKDVSCCAKSPAPNLAEAVSPDGRWLALVQGDQLPHDLGSLPDAPPRLVVLDLTDGREVFRQELLNPAVLDGLRAKTLAEIHERYPDEARSPLAWELATPLPGASPVPVDTYEDSGYWTGPAVATEVAGGFNSGFGHFAWSPDGRRLAVIAALGDSESDVYLLEVDGWRWSLPLADPGFPGALFWRPDSRQLFVLGAELAFMAAGAANVRQAWLLDAAGPALLGQWNASSRAGFDDYLQGWTADGEAVTIEGNHGCFICDIRLLRLPDLVVPVFGPEDADGAVDQVDVAVRSISAWSEGEWLGLSSEYLPSGPATPPDGASTAEGTKPEKPGNFLLHLGDGRLERVGDDAFDPLLYWGSPKYPFVLLGNRPVAVGPGGKRLALGILPGANRGLAMAPNGQWRVLHGSRGAWIFDRQAQRQAEWTQGPVADPIWSPEGDRMLWVSGQQLWGMVLPGGEARQVGTWKAEQAARFSLIPLHEGVAWLRPH